MRKASKLIMAAGQLLCLPEDQGQGDGGMIVQRENSDQAIARVVAHCENQKKYIVDTIVVYKRVVAQDIRMVDDEGSEQLYKILNEEDVVGYFESRS